MVRFNAKIDTSVAVPIRRSNANVSTIAMMPTPIGSIAAMTPPNTTMSTRKLMGIAIASATARSRVVCSLTCWKTMPWPPTRTVMPSRVPSNREATSLACAGASASPPSSVAMISAELRSLLTKPDASIGSCHTDRIGCCT
ncbi:Uncharacterised protein [Mycobacteroides abscessus subsp. abscessus]|nr:Uncharacterised protein [Mycobacteroides abscessus subsp. abscessus]